MDTLRIWLDEAGFDWKNGIILYQETNGGSPGWSNPSKDTIQIDKNHQILDHEFYSGFGGPECPRIFARDTEKVYFPGQYDGSTWLEVLYINPDYYIGNKNPTPYPGG